jgi:hypothetical protein
MNMSTAKAHIKLETWEWIPDQVPSACHVIVYDPNTIMPVYQGMTSIGGYLEFDIEPGMYVIWVYGHNPIGYRPFLADTWVPIAVLPGETKEVCAALVSLIDIPVLYNAARTGTRWEPETFAKLLGQYAAEVLEACNATAIQQREALREEVGDLEEGVVKRVEKVLDVRGLLLERRHEWAERVVRAAQEHAPKAVAEAEEAGRKAVEAMEKRIEAASKAECCSEMGERHLDFSTLPGPPGPLPATFSFCGVKFTRIWREIKKEGGSLWCWGSEEWPPSNWHDATVELDFTQLPCLVCKIVAEVDGHGPEARLVGRLKDGTTQTAVCPGDKRTLTLTASPGNPFIFATLSGQEAEWFGIRLE